MWILIAIAAFFLLSKSGSLGSLGGLLAPSLYQLTPADISEIASHYHDGSNTFQIQDNNNPFIGPGVQRYSLARAMQLAIQNLQVVAYSGDGFCQGIGTPDSKTVVTAEASQALAKISASDPEPISHTILAIASKVFGFIGAHHAAAVQKENGILCPLVPRLNGEYAAVLQAMQSGQINGATVMVNVQAIQSQAHQVISTDSGSGALHAVGEEVDAITEAFGLIVKNSGI